MSIKVDLPALGESVVEGTVSRWLVQVGEAVEADQPLVEVTTDKVDAEIPSPAAGVLERILVAEGEVVEVGGTLALIDPHAPARRPATASRGGEEDRPEQVGKPLVEEPTSPADRAATSLPSAPPPPATPVARRLAEEAKVSLEAIEGSGSGGRVTKSDVLRHARSGTAETQAVPESAPAPVVARGPRPGAGRPSYASYSLQPGDRVIPMSPMRRIIAEHMVYSKHTSPHVGTVAEVDMGGVAQLRERHKRAFEEAHGIRLTFLPFIVHALVRALRDYPALNASVIEDAIVEKKDINVGLAVETEKGLVVPVVRQADRLSLSGLAAAIEDLASRARSKRLSADDLQGGTFTVSNPGRQGNLYGFAIINQPQVGILRMGEMVKRPVVRSIAGEDAIVIRPMMHVALSYDHRAVDGAPANGFLYRIRELLEAAEFDL